MGQVGTGGNRQKSRPPSADGLPEMPEASDLASALTRGHETPSGPAWNTRGRRPGNGPGPRVHEDGTVTLQSGRYNNAHIILCQFDDLNLVAEFDRGEKVTFTGTVERAKRGRDRMGKASLKGCRTAAGERR